MRSAQRQTGLFKSSIGETVKQLGILTSAGAVVAGGFSAVKKSMDFESEMSTIKALTGATGGQMKQMTNLALQMGAKTKYNALEAAQGIEELLKSGMQPATVQAGGLEAALNMATAGGMSLADSASLMSNSLNAFRNDGLKAAQVSNILAGAANASSADMIDLKYGLAAVGPVAAGVKMSLRDTSAALALFSNNNLQGQDAGTSFKTMLMNLSPQTKKAAALMKEFGIITKNGTDQFFDAKGKVKGLADVAEVLRQSLKNLNPKEQGDALKQMFGSDAIRAGRILLTEGADGVKKMYGEMSKVTALDVAKQKMNNASGAVEQFKGAMETLQISALMPTLPVIKQIATELANWVSNLKPGQIQAFGDTVKNILLTIVNLVKSVVAHWNMISGVLIGAAVAVGVFKTAMVGLSIVGGVIKLMKAWRTATMAATLAEMGLNAAMWANPITGVVALIAVLIGIIVVLVLRWHQVTSALAYAWNHFKKTRNVILILLGPIGLIIAAAVSLASHWKTVSAVWSTVWNGIKTKAASSINSVIGGINKMIGVINRIPGVNIPIIPKVNWGSSGSKAKGGSPMSMSQHVQMVKYAHSHAGGLSNVPYDQYAASLHKGERVLTRSENEAYTRGNGRNTYQFGDIIIQGGPTDKVTVSRLMDAIANEIEAAGNGGA
jgi:TP901 family phage tail tape measure protein